LPESFSQEAFSNRLEQCTLKNNRQPAECKVKLKFSQAMTQADVAEIASFSRLVKILQALKQSMPIQMMTWWLNLLSLAAQLTLSLVINISSQWGNTTQSKSSTLLTLLFCQTWFSK
jgi:hypothetical protein